MRARHDAGDSADGARAPRAAPERSLDPWAPVAGWPYPGDLAEAHAERLPLSEAAVALGLSSGSSILRLSRRGGYRRWWWPADPEVLVSLEGFKRAQQAPPPPPSTRRSAPRPAPAPPRAPGAAPELVTRAWRLLEEFEGPGARRLLEALVAAGYGPPGTPQLRKVLGCCPKRFPCACGRSYSDHEAARELAVELRRAGGGSGLPRPPGPIRPAPVLSPEEVLELVAAFASYQGGTLLGLVLFRASTGVCRDDAAALLQADLDRGAAVALCGGRSVRVPRGVLAHLPEGPLESRVFPRPLRGAWGEVLEGLGWAARGLSLRAVHESWRAWAPRQLPLAVRGWRSVLGARELVLATA